MFRFESFSSSSVVCSPPVVYDRIASYHVELPMWLGTEHLVYNMLPFIAMVVLVISLIYHIWKFLFVAFLPKSSSSRQQQQQHEQQQQAAYQLTNLTVNLVLGLLGLYHFLYTLPDAPSLDDQVIGAHHLYVLAATQIGYQLWSLYMAGLWGVAEESQSMLWHHVAVLLISSMPGFLTIGFRYFTPFFFGMVELSSVPLSILNGFKNNREYIERYPGVYNATKLLFAFLFLLFRWIMYYPRKMIFLKYALCSIQTSTSLQFQVFMLFVCASSVFISSLQLYWGCLIVKGLSKMLMQAIRVRRVAGDGAKVKQT